MWNSPTTRKRLSGSTADNTTTSSSPKWRFSWNNTGGRSSGVNPRKVSPVASSAGAPGGGVNHSPPTPTSRDSHVFQQQPPPPSSTLLPLTSASGKNIAELSGLELGLGIDDDNGDFPLIKFSDGKFIETIRGFVDGRGGGDGGNSTGNGKRSGKQSKKASMKAKKGKSVKAKGKG